MELPELIAILQGIDQRAKADANIGAWDCMAVIASPAWKSLTKTATDVANICRSKYLARETFDFTVSEAVEVYGMTSPTFCKAMAQLVDVGFVSKSGGSSGTKSWYTLSDEWQTWNTDSKIERRPNGAVFFVCDQDKGAKTLDVVKLAISKHLKQAVM